MDKFLIFAGTLFLLLAFVDRDFTFGSARIPSLPTKKRRTAAAVMGVCLISVGLFVYMRQKSVPCGSQVNLQTGPATASGTGNTANSGQMGDLSQKGTPCNQQ